MIWWIVVFFNHKTAYEMRISDWSSDVCSSDLPGEIDLDTSDVAVDIDAAGHDDLASQIEGAIDARAGARIGDDAPVLDEEVGRDAIAAVGGIDDEAAGEQIGRAHV